jgi:hypothetical protein
MIPINNINMCNPMSKPIVVRRETKEIKLAIGWCIGSDFDHLDASRVS